MTALLNLLDVAPSPLDGGPGTVIAVVFFLVFAAIAAFLFFMIKKTVKMAIRMVIVAIVMVIALVGSIALWFAFGSSGGGKGAPPRPGANRPAR